MAKKKEEEKEITPEETPETPETPETEENKIPEETPPVGVSLSSDDIPDLTGLGIGDTITLRITNVSDDGKTFNLETVAPAEAATPTPSGREQVAKAMI